MRLRFFEAFRKRGGRSSFSLTPSRRQGKVSSSCGRVSCYSHAINSERGAAVVDCPGMESGKDREMTAGNLDAIR